MGIGIGVFDKGTTGGATSVATAGVNTQASGSSGCVGIVTADATAVTVPTDNKGNNWTLLGSAPFFAGGNKKITRFKSDNYVGGAGHIIGANLAPADAATILHQELTSSSGADTAASASSDDTATPFTATSGTPAQAAHAAVSFFAGDVGTNAASTEGSGMTKTAEEQDGASLYDLACAVEIRNSSSAKTASWTRATATDCGVTIDLFKEAAAGGSQTPEPWQKHGAQGVMVSM